MSTTIIQTFLSSDFIGKFITIAIIVLSIYAWFVILDKVRMLGAAERNSRLFLQQFRTHRDRQLFSLRFPRERAHACPVYRVYEAGVKELRHIMGDAEPLEEANPGLPLSQLEGVEESLQRAISGETDLLERSLIWLAISATVGPLLGLLGTVWGIMSAFNAMAASGSPSLLIVAPGIAGALITTVVGLLVAIPSVAAYNIISTRIKRMAGQMEDFASEFVSIVRRRLVAY
ncbi:MAG: MotA/TolQ/ExbB proton channel family protein [bacterium]|nr:MotA/TolQ/ExbB proton channel family protein [bacterium]